MGGGFIAPIVLIPLFCYLHKLNTVFEITAIISGFYPVLSQTVQLIAIISGFTLYLCTYQALSQWNQTADARGSSWSLEDMSEMD